MNKITILFKDIEIYKGENTLAKQANLKNLKSAHSKAAQKKEVIIGDYKILVNQVFLPTRISEAVQEFANDVLESAKLEQDLVSEILEFYMQIVLIKHFTSLDVPEDINGKIETLQILVDLDLFTDIISEFPEDEIKKVYEAVNNKSETINKDMDELAEKVEVMGLNNDEVKEAVLSVVGEEK